jgi:hypothetical protein
MCIGIGAEYAAVAGFRFQHGTTAGAHMEDLSVVGGNVEQFYVSALWAGQVCLCNQFLVLIILHSVQFLTKMTCGSFIYQQPPFHLPGGKRSSFRPHHPSERSGQAGEAASNQLPTVGNYKPSSNRKVKDTGLQIAALHYSVSE